jgi:hypothetical protein
MKLNPLDAVASITLTLLANGAMGISGNIGDKKLALSMIDAAREAVNGQLRPEDDKSLILPARDVQAVQHPSYPTLALGDM